MQKTVENRDFTQDFSRFLKELYPDRLSEISSNYPEKTRLRISFDDLEQFDEDLAQGYRLNQRVRRKADEALRYHESIKGAAYLPKARVIAERAPMVVGVHELKTSYNSAIVSVKGKIVEIGKLKQEVFQAAFICRDCGTRNTVNTRRKLLEEPYACRGCEKIRTEYRLDKDKSTYYDKRVIELQSLTRESNNISRPWTLSIHLVDDAAFEARPGDWVICTGKLTFSGDGASDVEPYMVGHQIESQEPEALLEEEEEVRLYEKSRHELSREHILGFVTHTEDVFEKFETETMSEEDVKTKVITPFIELLGWDPYSPEVMMEHGIGNDARPDYVLAINDRPLVAIEAKSPSVSTSTAKLVQLDDYVAEGNAKFGLLTNGKQYKIVKNPNHRKRYNPHVEGHLLLDVSYELLPSFETELGLLTRSFHTT